MKKILIGIPVLLLVPIWVPILAMTLLFSLGGDLFLDTWPEIKKVFKK